MAPKEMGSSEAGKVIPPQNDLEYDLWIENQKSRFLGRLNKEGIARTSAEAAELVAKLQNEDMGSFEFEEDLCKVAVDVAKNIFVFAKRQCKDGNFRFTFANPALCEALGVDKNSILGKTDAKLGFKQSEVDAFAKADKEIMKGGLVGKHATRREQLTPKGKKTITLQTMKEVVELSPGQLRIVGVATDITELASLEYKSKFDTEIVASVLDAFDMSIWIKDLDARFIRVNKHFSDRHKYSCPDDMVGKRDSDHWPDDVATAFVEDDCEVAVSKRTKGPYQEELKWDDGSTSTILTTKTPIFGEDGRVIAILGMCEVLEHSDCDKSTSRRQDVCKARIKQATNVVQASLKSLNLHFHEPV